MYTVGRDRSEDYRLRWRKIQIFRGSTDTCIDMGMHHSRPSLSQLTVIANKYSPTAAFNGVHLRHLLQEAGDMHVMSVSTRIFQLYAVITSAGKTFTGHQIRC